MSRESIGLSESHYAVGLYFYLIFSDILQPVTKNDQNNLEKGKRNTRGWPYEIQKVLNRL